MSFLWTLVATFLYLEVAIILLLVLPIFSPQTWNSIFNSPFFQLMQQGSRLRNWFLAQSGSLSVLLLDAVREMIKYTSDVDADRLENMRLFRAERNFYICGFALFLSLVIRRLVSFISIQAHLITKLEELTGLKNKVEELEGKLRVALAENTQAFKDQAQSYVVGLGNKLQQKILGSTSSHINNNANAE